MFVYLLPFLFVSVFAVDFMNCPDCPTITNVKTSQSDTVSVFFDKEIGIFGYNGWWIHSSYCGMNEIAELYILDNKTIYFFYDYEYCGDAVLIITKVGAENIYDKNGNRMFMMGDYYEEWSVM